MFSLLTVSNFGDPSERIIFSSWSVLSRATMSPCSLVLLLPERLISQAVTGDHCAVVCSPSHRLHLLLIQILILQLDFTAYVPTSASVSSVITPFYGFPQNGLPKASVVALGRFLYISCWAHGPGVHP